MSSGSGSPFDDEARRKLWQERVQEYGARSVISLLYEPEHYDSVTDGQKQAMLPILQQQLTGRERTLLDFGCGPGRFSPALAKLLGDGASVLGFDIAQEMIDLAPPAPGVRYTSSASELASPALKRHFDVIWMSLVLGGLPDGKCVETVRELLEMLAPGGLVFLIDHVSDTKRGNTFWKFRTFTEYHTMFSPIRLEIVGAYVLLDEEVWIMAGRAAS